MMTLKLCLNCAEIITCIMFLRESGGAEVSRGNNLSDLLKDPSLFWLDTAENSVELFCCDDGF